MGTILALLGVLAYLFAGAVLGGWVVMLLIGFLHGTIFPGLPPIGFWPSVLWGLLLSFVFGLLRGSSK